MSTIGLKMNKIFTYLDELISNPVCELEFNKDYELLIATVLSAQTTDKRVNKVTRVLFKKYPSIEALSKASIKDIESIIKEIGTYHKKAIFVKDIATRLLNDNIKVLPNNRKYLESLPGVGRKTTNVFLSVIYNEPAIAVDTHVARVSKRLGLANEDDTVDIIEKKLMKKVPKERWSRTHHQLVLFGRYHCKAVKPECNGCKLGEFCKYKKDLYVQRQNK